MVEIEPQPRHVNYLPWWLQLLLAPLLLPLAIAGFACTLALLIVLGPPALILRLLNGGRRAVAE